MPLKNDTMLDGLQTVKLKLSSPSAGALGDPSMSDHHGRRQRHGGDLPVHQRDLHRHRGRDRERHRDHHRHADRAAPAGPSTSRGASPAAPRPRTTRRHPGVRRLVPPAARSPSARMSRAKTIQATIVSDADVEPNETVILELGTPTPGGGLGSSRPRRLVVVDSDRKGTIQFAAPVLTAAEANATVTIRVTRTGNLGEAATSTGRSPAAPRPAETRPAPASTTCRRRRHPDVRRRASDADAAPHDRRQLRRRARDTGNRGARPREPEHGLGARLDRGDDADARRGDDPVLGPPLHRERGQREQDRHRHPERGDDPGRHGELRGRAARLRDAQPPRRGRARPAPTTGPSAAR